MDLGLAGFHVEMEKLGGPILVLVVAVAAAQSAQQGKRLSHRGQKSTSSLVVELGAKVGGGGVGASTRDKGGGDEGPGARKDAAFIPSRLPPCPFPPLPEVLRLPLSWGTRSMELDPLAAAWQQGCEGKM
jgi:hypothetical protein